jgi:hypothetical protein
LSLKHWANVSWAAVVADDGAALGCSAGTVLDEHAAAVPINAAAAAPRTATRTGLPITISPSRVNWRPRR